MALTLTAAVDSANAKSTVTLDWAQTVNLAPNPSAETNTTNWFVNSAGGTATLTRPTTGGTSGTGFGRATWSAAMTQLGIGGITHGSGTSSVIPVTAGVVYSARVDVRHNHTVTVPMALRVYWYDASNTNIATTIPATVQVAANTWTTLTNVNMTAPANAVRCLLAAYLSTGATAAHQFQINEWLDCDGFMVVASANLPAYFDGDSAYATWTGTAHASTSRTLVPTTVTLTRVYPDGSTYPVRNAEPATLLSGLWVGDDFEVPIGTDFTYTATADDIPGAVLTSPTYRINTTDTWLKHPGQPALNNHFDVQHGPDLTHPVSQGIFDVIGRTTPIAVSLRRNSARGELTLITWDATERAALLGLLQDGTPLLFTAPDDHGIGPAYLAIGEVTEERISPIGNRPERRWTLDFTIVDRPTGAALAVGNTWADANGTYTSWQTLQATEGTWQGLLAGLGA